MAQLVKNLPAMEETWVPSLGLGKIPWKSEWQSTPLFLPGEFHWTEELQATVHGVTKSWTWLSDFHFQWIWPLINQTLFSWAPKSLQMVTVAMKLNDADEPGQHIKKKRHHFAHKAPYSQSYGFSSSHIRM